MERGRQLRAERKKKGRAVKETRGGEEERREERKRERKSKRVNVQQWPREQRKTWGGRERERDWARNRRSFTK